MSVAVIIPIYNAQKYISEAIDSCLLQNEVKQIILVDDGSEDDSLKICQKIAKKYNHIYVHSHKKNKGRSAARNAGMKIVKESFFSFLDADDYFGKNRFVKPISFMNSHFEADGVYEAVASDLREGVSQENYQEITGIKKGILPEDLFSHLLLSDEHFSIIGCTFRASSIIDHFWFDESLGVGEDTDFLWQLARTQSLLGIHSEPTVVRRVHSGNTAFNKPLSIKGKYHLYKKWKNNLENTNLPKKIKKKIISSYSYYKSLYNSASGDHSLIEQRVYQGIEFLKRPSLWPSLFQ